MLAPSATVSIQGSCVNLRNPKPPLEPKSTFRASLLTFRVRAKLCRLSSSSQLHPAVRVEQTVSLCMQLCDSQHRSSTFSLFGDFWLGGLGERNFSSGKCDGSFFVSTSVGIKIRDIKRDDDGSGEAADGASVCRGVFLDCQGQVFQQVRNKTKLKFERRGGELHFEMCGAIH